MILPKFRKTVKIHFWSLRNGLGPGMGVVYDIDTMVERNAYRVKLGRGKWKWRIRGYNRLVPGDMTVETDQDILDEYGSGMEVDIVQYGESEFKGVL